MSNINEWMEEHQGQVNALGHLAAINQRNRQIEQQKEQAAALRAQMRIPMKADTCSDSYRTLIRRYRTVVGAKRRSEVSNKELSDMRQENRT